MLSQVGSYAGKTTNSVSRKNGTLTTKTKKALLAALDKDAIRPLQFAQCLERFQHSRRTGCSTASRTNKRVVSTREKVGTWSKAWNNKCRKLSNYHCKAS